jgi:hypothetical protein
MQTWVIVLRLFHILCSVFWVGGITLLTFFLLPALDATAASGAVVMKHLLNRTKLVAFLPVMGVLTVLSGFLLYWRDTSISAGAFAKSATGMAFGLGGAAGLLALIVGGAIASRSAAAMARIYADVDRSGGAPSTDQAAELGALGRRLKSGSHATWGLMLIALVAMAVARYV